MLVGIGIDNEVGFGTDKDTTSFLLSGIGIAKEIGGLDKDAGFTSETSKLSFLEL